MKNVETNNKEVVKAVKETIKELVSEHKKNLKYRPYAQDIKYAMEKKGSYRLTTTQINQILIDNNIKIDQPKDPVNDPKSQKLVATK